MGHLRMRRLHTSVRQPVHSSASISSIQLLLENEALSSGEQPYMPRDDWTPQQILLELNARNIQLHDLVKTEWIGLGHFFELEQAIAKAINTPLHTIWPSRYSKIDS